MKWKSLQKPKAVKKEENSYTNQFGRFYIEPLERGYGLTLGNSLRRVLLSSLQGAAISAVKIDGILHEFSTVRGVVEDVSEILLNLKKLRIKMSSEGPVTLKIEMHGEGEVKAGDIEAHPDVDIINKDLHIATINEKANFKMELTVSDGRGYVPAEELKKDNTNLGMIFLDVLYSPVTKVNYFVENTRVGHRVDFDKLTIEVHTDGSITPEDALAYAAKILQDQLNVFVNFEGDLAAPQQEEKRDEEKERVKAILKMRVDELELSVRSSNCLRAAKIETIGDLVKNSEPEMLKYKNFGRKSLTELNSILQNLGIHFGMDIAQYQD